MMTVRSTLLAFIKSSSISGVASNSGGRVVSFAKGYFGSRFHTWTCGSMMRILEGAAVIVLSAADARNARRLDIDWFQLVHDVGPAALVAGAGTFAGTVEVDANPAFEIDAFEDAMAGN